MLVPQSEGIHEALEFRKVPTAMNRLNEEWRRTSSDPSNCLRTPLDLRSWFERWTHGAAATTQ